MKRVKKYLTIFLVVLILLIIIIQLKDSVLLDPNYLQNLIEGTGIWAPIVFALIYILITVLGISAAVFTILAGTIFGTLNGLILVVIAATIAATIAFYISRFFREKFENNKKGNSKKNIVNDIIKKIEKRSEKNGFETIAVLRLTFLPYIPLSYAAGLVKNLRARDFILATLITNVFGSFVFIFLGDKLGEILKGNIGLETVLTLIIAIVLLVLFIVIVPRVMRKFEK